MEVSQKITKQKLPWRSRLNYQRSLFAAIFVIAIVGIFSLRQVGAIDAAKIFAWLHAYPLLAPTLFILIYTFLSVFIVPTLPLNIGAGILWGTVWGSLFSILGATLGAVCAFLISRYLFGNWFRRKFKHKAWVWLLEEIAKSGWRIVAFTRINPVFAFGPLNYFFGISPISLPTYIWATALFITPPSILFAFAGYSMRDIALRGASHDFVQTLLIGSAVLTLLVFLRRFTVYWHKRNYS